MPNRERVQEMPKSPFDTLAEHYGPNGRGFDTDNPFFKATWAYDAFTETYDRRSRAEAALPLFEATRQKGWIIGLHGDSRGWRCVITRSPDYGNSEYEPTPEDALCAAILAKEGVKADA